MLKKETSASFVYVDVKRRTKKKTFFNQIDQIINWTKISQELNKKIKRSNKDSYGRPAYAPIILFKMMLLQIWYNLSDESVEEMVNDTLSANEFCGLKVEDTVPDHSTLSRFRKELTELKIMDKLLNKINKQLKKHNLILQAGVIVDATITESPYVDTNPQYEITQDREDEEDVEEVKEEEKEEKLTISDLKKHPSNAVDAEAKWLKKGKKTYFGYKQHVASDINGMILSVHTVAANEYEGKGLSPLLNKLIKETPPKSLFTDKGYSSKTNRDLLKSHGIKDRIQKKGCRDNPLSYWAKQFNKIAGKTRYAIERTFGGIKKWFGGGICRYKGLCKTHTQHIIQAIAYNLKRAPGLLLKTV